MGVALAQLAELPVLPGHERLLHRRQLEVEILVGQVEVGREGLDHAALVVLLEHERVRLVLPRHAVVVEHLRTLTFHIVGEAGLVCM